MAVLTFHERYTQDLRFKEKVDGLLMEAVFAHFGVDTEAVVRRWETGDQELSFASVMRQKEGKLEAKPVPPKEAPKPEEDEPEEDEPKKRPAPRGRRVIVKK